MSDAAINAYKAAIADGTMTPETILAVAKTGDESALTMCSVWRHEVDGSQTLLNQVYDALAANPKPRRPM